MNGNSRKDFADVTLSLNQTTWIGANEPLAAVRTSVQTILVVAWHPALTAGLDVEKWGRWAGSRR